MSEIIVPEFKAPFNRDEWISFRDTVQLNNTEVIRNNWVTLLPRIFSVDDGARWVMWFNGTISMITDMFPFAKGELFS
jgi:hypothetical protein